MPHGEFLLVLHYEEKGNTSSLENLQSLGSLSQKEISKFYMIKNMALSLL